MPASYFPLDLNFFDHPKVVGLSDKAVRLYLSSVAYSNRLMTDGFIADAITGRLVEWDMNDLQPVTPRSCAGELDRAVLWHRADVACPRGHDLTCPKMDIGVGWRIHDFLDHNRSRSYRTSDREKERDRKAAYRERQRESQGDKDASVPPGHVPPGDEVSHRDRREEKRREEKKETVVAFRPDLDRLCNLLADAVQANTGERPKIGKRWHDACRLLLDTDGYTAEQVEALIRWSQTDEFWRSNILSMPKLRDKRLTLVAQMQRPTRANRSRAQRQVDDAVQTYQEMMADAGVRVGPDRGQAQRELSGPADHQAHR